MRRLLPWWALLLVMCGGCQSLLGLDDYKIVSDKELTADDAGPTDPDAGTDAPADPVCKVPKGAECALAPVNCGCERDETCRVADADGTTFCDEVGSSALQDACENDQECPAGSACIGRLCRPYCDAEAGCTAGLGECLAVQADDEPVPGAFACFGRCDPQNPERDDKQYTPCGKGSYCWPGYEKGPFTQSFCSAESPDAVAAGEACAADRDCESGLGCLGDVCQPFCRESADCNSDVAEPECWNGFSLVGNDGDSLGLCCGPAAPQGSNCTLAPFSCGCGDGKTCRIMDPETGQTGCDDVGGAELLGRCELNADCPAATACVGGLCRVHCSPALGCTEQMGECKQVLNQTEPVPGEFICMGHCDPIQPNQDDDSFTPCGDGAYCHPGDDTGFSEVGYCQSQPTPPASEGEACEQNRDCENGLGCLSGVCRAWCQKDTDCGDGELSGATCIKGLGHFSDSETELGLCCGPVAAAAGSECAVLPVNCGCPSGESCQVADGNTGRTICAAAGTGRREAPCELNNDCAPGLTCVGTLCRPYCNAEVGCAEGANACMNALSNDDPLPELMVCFGHCDPVTPNNAEPPFTPCASENTYCFPGIIGDYFQEALCSYAGKKLPLDSACEIATDCASGLGCLTPSAASGALGLANRCTPWCRTAQDCPAGYPVCNLDGNVVGHSSEDILGICDVVANMTPAQ